jgi:hypothetical protein
MSLTIGASAAAFSYPFLKSSANSADAFASPAANAAQPAPGLHAAQQAALAKIQDSAKSSIASGNAKSFLLSLSAESLSVLQEANDIALPINANQVSEVGAENLLLGPGHYVDPNNTGTIEVGQATLVTFPPLNAPQAVKDAWKATTSGLSDHDAELLGLQFIGISPSLGGDGDKVLSEEASPNFNWTALFNSMQYSNDITRPYNSPETSDKISALLTKFQAELKNHGVI